MKVKSCIPFDQYFNSHQRWPPYSVCWTSDGNFGCACLLVHKHMPTGFYRKSGVFLMVHINSILLYVFHFYLIFHSAHPEIVSCKALRSLLAFSIYAQYRYNMVLLNYTIHQQKMSVLFPQLSDSYKKKCSQFLPVKLVKNGILAVLRCISWIIKWILIPFHKFIDRLLYFCDLLIFILGSLTTESFKINL